jgi:hypothetical protein
MEVLVDKDRTSPKLTTFNESHLKVIPCFKGRFGV